MDTWTGAQISLFIGIVAAVLDIFIGVVYGDIRFLWWSD